jgi:hypothetical protein
LQWLIQRLEGRVERIVAEVDGAAANIANA